MARHVAYHHEHNSLVLLLYFINNNSNKQKTKQTLIGIKVKKNIHQLAINLNIRADKYIHNIL